MAADVQACLGGVPVDARAPSVACVAGRFVRRHRVAVASAALAFSAVRLDGLAALHQARRAELALAQERAELAAAQQRCQQADALLARAQQRFPADAALRSQRAATLMLGVQVLAGDGKPNLSQPEAALAGLQQAEAR